MAKIYESTIGVKLMIPFAGSSRRFVRPSNHAGGIEGGNTNGEPVVARCSMKPIPTLARPLASSGQFPPDVMEMIAVGEEANNLEKVLLGIADKQEKLTQRRIDLFIRLLEPIMLLTMAVVILFVVLAILLPVFQSSSTVS